MSGSSAQPAGHGLDERGAEVLAEHRLHLLRGGVHDRLVHLRVLHHELADDADAHPLERARRAGGDRLRVGLRRDASPRHGREDVARVVVAVHRILERVEHLHRVGDAAADECRRDRCRCSTPIAPPWNESIALCGRMSATELWLAGPRHDCAGLLAQAAHREVGADRDAGARARPDRRRPRRVVRLARVPAPTCCADSPSVDGRTFVGMFGAAGVAGAPVVLGRVGLGVDDRALGRAAAPTSVWSRAGKSMS